MKKIIIVPGDGIGQEITESAVQVLKKVDEKFNIGLEYDYRDAGGTSYEKFGAPLTEETLEACKKADGVLFGAVGGDKWDSLPAHLRPEKAILGFRQGLKLFANLRPIKIYPELLDTSPLRRELVEGSDLIIVRELVGGIYFGPRCESELVDGIERAWDTEIYSVPEIERIAKLAFESAKIRRGKITSVDKANVLASSRLWRKIVANVAKNFPEIKLNHLYVDNAAMQLVLKPKQFDVILTNNMFGDILSDEASVIGGSIGLMPSASIGELTSLYEPIHGSAPDIAGRDIANPMGTILSAAMLLRYSLNEDKAAAAIELAIDKTLADGWRTADIFTDGFKKVGTNRITEIICDNL